MCGVFCFDKVWKVHIFWQSRKNMAFSEYMNFTPIDIETRILLNIFGSLLAYQLGVK